MHKNMGDSDSMLRVAMVTVLLVAAGAVTSVPGEIGLIILAALLLYTALAQWCPLYALLRIDTRAGPRGTPPPSAGRS